MKEAGFPDVDIKLFSGYFAAVGTPPGIVAKLEAGLQKAIKDPDVASKLKAMAVTPGGQPASEFRAMIDRDIQTISEVIKAANLKFDN
jgi:tripartite-type tricarboxylate transporter receptor subunit TctC